MILAFSVYEECQLKAETVRHTHRKEVVFRAKSRIEY